MQLGLELVRLRTGSQPVREARGGPDRGRLRKLVIGVSLTHPPNGQMADDPGLVRAVRATEVGRGRLGGV